MKHWDLKLATPACPTCGQLAAGTVEHIPGRANLTHGSNGNASWTGETTVCWDAMKSVRRLDEGPIRVDEDASAFKLICPEGHEWWSSWEDGNADDAATTKGEDHAATIQ